MPLPGGVLGHPLAVVHGLRREVVLSRGQHRRDIGRRHPFQVDDPGDPIQSAFAIIES